MNKQDAGYFAQTVARLNRAEVADRNPVDDALALHRIAGSLHRMDERACNESLTCKSCGGGGRTVAVRRSTMVACKACAGRGRTTGRREARLEAQATAIATAYGFRAYFQGDCRGCPLYLIPTSYPAAQDESHYSSYGHAVPWLG